MARQPNVVPFADGKPADNLEVEDIGNDEVLVGDPALDSIAEEDSTFDNNIAEEIDENDLNKKAQDLVGYFDSDKESRSDWEERYKQGLETLEPDGGMLEEEEQRATRGLSTVVHPMIAEAATQFNARAIAELYPSGGPVKTIVVGEPSEETEDQARRVRDFMNYQITQQMPEYYDDLDSMLFQLPLIGHAFKKVWWDSNLNRQCAQFVKAEDFIVAPESKDLYTSPRYTHIIRIPRNDFNRYVESGFYLPVKYVGSDTDPSSDIGQQIEGVDGYEDSESNPMVTLLEMHVYDIFDGIDGMTSDEENQVMLPYLGKAATGALRALLDSAAFANMQGGFKLKGRVTGGEMQINPGEFADLDATVDDVNKAIMPLPFKEPSGTLFNLMNAIVQAGQRFAATADLNVGDVNPNAPVGSTIALIEQGSKSFSAIHKRLHNAQGQEFKLLAKLNAKYLPEELNFAMSGVSSVIMAKDFDGRIDVIPVSDPNIFSTAQRIAQAQAILQMATSAPQLHDVYEAYRRMYEAIRIPNIDEILEKPAEAPRMDPIDENMSIMYGKPIRAFPEQDHDSHIAVHMQFLQDPSLGGNPSARGLQPVLIAHVAEHIALLYRTRMESAIGMPMPDLPDFKDPKFKFNDVDPRTDSMISQRAAQVVQQAPVMQQIRGLPQQQPNPLQYAQQLAQLEADALKARTAAQIQTDQAKAAQDLQIKDAQARQKLAADQAKIQQDLEGKIKKLELDLAIERKKNIEKGML